MGNKYVTHEECSNHIKELSEDVKRQGRAIYGPDGRGGMQKDVTEILFRLDNGSLKTCLSKGDKILLASITAVGSIIVTIIASGVI